MGRLKSQKPNGAVPPYILATPRVPILGSCEDWSEPSEPAGINAAKAS